MILTQNRVQKSVEGREKGILSERQVVGAGTREKKKIICLLDLRDILLPSKVVKTDIKLGFAGFFRCVALPPLTQSLFIVT